MFHSTIDQIYLFSCGSVSQNFNATLKTELKRSRKNNRIIRFIGLDRRSFRPQGIINVDT